VAVMRSDQTCKMIQGKTCEVLTKCYWLLGILKLPRVDGQELKESGTGLWRIKRIWTGQEE
jgi:hypothetical protein